MLQTFVNFLDYLFNFNPPTEFNLQYLIWIILSLAILSAVAIMIKIRRSNQKIEKRNLQEYPGKLITLAVLLGINLFSRLNRIELLSMRLITFFLSAWILYSFYEIYIDITKNIPNSMSETNNFHSQKKQYHIHKNKKKKHRLR